MSAPEATSQDVTAWRLGKIEEALVVMLGKLDDRPDWKDVRNIEAVLAERVKRLEDWQTWALRLGGPALVAAAIGIVVNASRITGA